MIYGIVLSRLKGGLVMDEKQQEVYNILNNIRVLTFKNYNKFYNKFVLFACF